MAMEVSETIRIKLTYFRPMFLFNIPPSKTSLFSGGKGRGDWPEMIKLFFFNSLMTEVPII